jgi:hypothetical protein
MSEHDAGDFQSVMRDNGLVVSSTGPLQQRSGIPSDPTVIVAVSGAIYAVAKAFTAYFQSKEKCIKVSNLETSFYVKNYTPDEVTKIVKAGNHVVLTDKPKDPATDDI